MSCRSVFIRELRSVAALTHPNIMTLYDVAEHERTTLAVMEFVRGQTVRRMIEGGLGWEIVARTAEGIARGLSAAHALNLMHRDIKPENIMVTPTGHSKLLDFGLARRVAPAPDQDLTQRAGGNPGTIPYMSPEQAAGLPLTCATDVFSFGTVLYEMLTGTNPFRAATASATLSRVIQAAPPPLRPLCDAPESLVQLVVRMLDRDPEQRPTIDAASSQLERIAQSLDASQNDSNLSTAVPTNVGARRPELVGRDRELMELGSRLRQHPIVTLVGPGGVGKTSLSVAAAQDSIRRLSGRSLGLRTSIAATGRRGARGIGERAGR